MLFLECVSPLLPHNVIPQRIRQLHGLAVAERAALEFAGEIGDAAAPAVFIGEVVHHLGHGHAGADDVGLDLIAIGFRFSHILTQFCPRIRKKWAGLDGNNGRSAERTVVKSTNRSRNDSDLPLRLPHNPEAVGSSPASATMASVLIAFERL